LSGHYRSKRWIWICGTAGVPSILADHDSIRQENPPDDALIPSNK
jgi:hypothetical protein